MTVQLIQQYYTNVEKLIQYGGFKNETAIVSVETMKIIKEMESGG